MSRTIRQLSLLAHASLCVGWAIFGAHLCLIGVVAKVLA